MSLENKVLAACAEVRGKAIASLRALEGIAPELARPRAEQAITALASTKLSLRLRPGKRGAYRKS